MEYAEGGDLYSHLIKKRNFSEDFSRKIFQQIIDALYYLHQIGICHRDLRLENIFFSSKNGETIKIINFGHSKEYLTGVNSDNPTLSFGAEFLETPFNSKEYTPPEVILGCKYDGMLSDIWSCGIILYLMLIGSFPFEDKNMEKLYTKIIKGEFNYPKNIHISEDADLLLKKILVVNPRLRSDIIDIKRDNWFIKEYKQTLGLFISIREIPISDKIIEEMEKNGIQKDKIKEYIKTNRHNNITAFYYILSNKFRKEGIENISDLISREFTNYLKEQDLKYNLIKKREKPISLKIMKTNSKLLFDINLSSENENNQKVDLDFLKSIFREHKSGDVKTESNKKINKINIYPIRKINETKKKMNNKNSKSKNKKRAKSQKDKKINKKNLNIFKARFSYSTSLTCKNNKKNKEELKMKLLHKNKNLTKEKKESMDKKNKKTKLRTIKNIKETIILKNKLIINHDSKRLSLAESKLNPIKNELIYNSTSFSNNKKKLSIINKNALNYINDLKKKLNQIKQPKKKHIKNNIKNLSLKNQYINHNNNKFHLFSRNYFESELNSENKTFRNYNHKYMTNSTSDSKSKSIKSKSNYSTGKTETFLYKNYYRNRKKKNIFDVKVNVIRPSLENKNNNVSKDNLLKEKNKRNQKKSKSNSKPKSKIVDKKINNLIIQNKIMEQSKKEVRKNSSKSKSINKNEENIYKIKSQRIKKQRTNQQLNSFNSKEKVSIRENIFKENISMSNKNHLKKDENNDKTYYFNLQKIIPNNKDVSPVKKKISNKKSFNIITNHIIQNYKNNNTTIQTNKNNKINKSSCTNLKMFNKRENSNKITNIKKSSPLYEKDKKEEIKNKMKMEEIKSIKIYNFPKSDKSYKTIINSNNIKNNKLNNTYLKEKTIKYKNRLVLNLK